MFEESLETVVLSGAGCITGYKFPSGNGAETPDERKSEAQTDGFAHHVYADIEHTEHAM